MTNTKVPPRRDTGQVSALLDSPEIRALIERLEATRWTGRPGYPIRTMIGMALAKAVYAVPTWTRMVRLAGEIDGLRVLFGGEIPSQWACYRFAGKLREHSDALTACIDAVVAGVKAVRPEYGTAVAIDGSDLPAYANGHRTILGSGKERTRFADPDATWGHRSSISTRKGGGYYGYKLHAAVCAITDLPVAWVVRTASDYEGAEVEGLLDTIIRRGITPEHAIMDKGYDASAVYALCEKRRIRPVIPLKMTVNVFHGKDKPPSCAHGTWASPGQTRAGARQNGAAPAASAHPVPFG